MTTQYLDTGHSVSAVLHITRSYMGGAHLKRKLCYTDKAGVVASYVAGCYNTINS